MTARGTSVKLALRTRGQVCDACATAGPSIARWCGACGEWLEGGTAAAPLGVPRRPGLRADDAPRPAPSMVPVAPAEGEGTGEPGRGRAARDDAATVRRRRVVAAAVVAVAASVAGTTVVTAERSSQATSLVGALDDASGRSSPTTPGDELRLLWRRPLETVAEPGPALVPTLLDDTHLLVGGTVVDLERGTVEARGVPAPGPDGRSVLVDGEELLLVAPATGTVMERADVRGGASWLPSGEVLGWLEGVVVLAGVDGRAAAVELAGPTLGTVRWVLESGTEWRPGGDAARGVVLTPSPDVRSNSGTIGVVDAEDGSVVRIDGHTVGWDDQVVVGDVLVAQVGARLEAYRTDTGAPVWVVEVPALLLQPGDMTTLWRPPAGVVPGRDGAFAPAIAVSGRAAGGSTTAAWFDVRDGSLLGATTAGGVGLGTGGWPLAGVAGTDLVHADPIRDEVRAVDMYGRVRWSVPVDGQQGLVVGPTHALLWSGPPAGGTQGRLRLLEVATGRTVWDHVDGSGVDAVITALVAGQLAVVLPDSEPGLARLSVYELEKGRRRPGLGAVVRAAGSRWARAHPDAPSLRLLGMREIDGQRRPVTVLLPDGTRRSGSKGPSTPQLIGPGDRRVALPPGADVSGAVVVGDAVVLGAPDGRTAWSIDASGEVVTLDGVRPLAGSSGLLIARLDTGAQGGLVAGVDLSDASVAWRGPVLPAGATVRTTAESVVVATPGGLMALDPADGSVRWEVEHHVLADHSGTVLHAERVDVLGADGRVRAYDLVDGSPVWTSPPGLGVGRVLSGAGDMTLVGTEGGRVLLLDATGEVNRIIDAGRDPVEDVVVVDGMVIASVGANLVAFGPGAWFVEDTDTVRLP